MRCTTHAFVQRMAGQSSQPATMASAFVVLFFICVVILPAAETKSVTADPRSGANDDAGVWQSRLSMSRMAASLAGLSRRQAILEDYVRGFVNRSATQLSTFIETLERRMTTSLAQHLQPLQASIEQLKNNISQISSHPDRVHTEGTMASDLDGGGWTLVWKHSYRQVLGFDLAKAKTYSHFSKPCTDLLDGWCNVPNKRPPGAREQMIAAYHMGTAVYAYKSPSNPDLGRTEMGANLVSGWSKVLDLCARNNGVRPAVSRHDGPNDLIVGISFDKASPDAVDVNCDTTFQYYQDCRWNDCRLPSSVSSEPYDTQMTLAIFVR